MDDVTDNFDVSEFAQGVVGLALVTIGSFLTMTYVTQAFATIHRAIANPGPSDTTVGHYIWTKMLYIFMWFGFLAGLTFPLLNPEINSGDQNMDIFLAMTMIAMVGFWARLIFCQKRLVQQYQAEFDAKTGGARAPQRSLHLSATPVTISLNSTPAAVSRHPSPQR